MSRFLHLEIVLVQTQIVLVWVYAFGLLRSFQTLGKNYPLIRLKAFPIQMYGKQEHYPNQFTCDAGQIASCASFITTPFALSHVAGRKPEVLTNKQNSKQ